METQQASIGQMIKSREMTMKCQVLRKKIKSLEDGSVRYVYTSDPKAVNKFLKRRKLVLRQRPAAKQKQNASVMTLAEINAMMNYGESDLQGQDATQTSLISIPAIY